jgi:hypothetical protein
MKAILIIVCIVAVASLGWIFTANDLAMFKFFAPKYEQARRETFEESKSYRQGSIQELQNMQFQYEQANPEHKEALAAIILRRSADFTDLPPDLRLFINQLKNNTPKY